MTLPTRLFRIGKLIPATPLNTLLGAVCALTLMVTSGSAQTPVETLRTLLETGDVAGLEREMQNLDQRARASGSASDLRHIEHRLFETSHPERITVINAWRRAYPDSIYALAAETWVAIKAVDLRGHDYNRYGEPAASDQVALWKEARARAFRLADLIEKKEKKFTLASDAWLRVMGIKHSSYARLKSELASFVTIAPERESVLRVVDVLYEASSNPAQDVAMVCLEIANLATDYDSDRCIIEAAITKHLREDARIAAEQQLQKLQDPNLDAARFWTLFRARPKDDQQRDNLVLLHSKLLDVQTDLVRYLRMAQAVAHFAQRPAYLDQAKQRVSKILDARLKDDPLDPRLLMSKAEMLSETYSKNGQAEDLAHARALWQDAMVYGQYSPVVWRLGAQLAMADKDPSDFTAQQVFLENTIAYSGQKVQYILEYHFALSHARQAALQQAGSTDKALQEQAAQTLADIECPMLRSAKVAGALCKTLGPEFDLCHPEKPFFESVLTTLSEGSDTWCPALHQTNLSALRYEATAFEDIELPW